MKQTLLSTDGRIGRLSLLVMIFTFFALQHSALAQLTANVTSTTNVTCFGGNDGAIDIDVTGGTPPYSFDWSHGPTTKDVSGLTASSYSVIVTDALLNTTSTGANITQPSQLTASKVTKDVSCNGGSDGSITLSVNGGTSPYYYAWNTGDVTSSITNRPSGAYNVTVSDANGCSVYLVDTIGEPSEFMLLFSGSTNVSCHGGSDGSATYLPVGGILPYTFIWSNGQVTKDLTGVPAGTYSVVAADNNGCKDYDTITITEPAQALSASVNVTNSTCYYSTDGALDITVSGGVAPYTYLWSTSDNTEDLNGISAGDYSVTITDVNSCQLVIDTAVQAVDNVPPVAVCQNIDLYLDASGTAVVTAAELDNGSTDNCSIDTIILNKYTFGCADLGPVSVELVVYDSNGNTDTCMASVNVLDTVSPAVNTQDFTVYLDAGGQASVTVADFNNASSDACGLDTLFLDNYNFYCADIGQQQVMLTAIDINGNIASGTANLTVIDSIDPVAAAQDLNVYLDINGQASITAAQIDNGSSDFCGIDTLILDQYDFVCEDLGLQLVNLTVVDFGGNTDVASANVTVIDTISPVIDAEDINAYLDNTGNVSITAADVVTSGTDACGMDTIILDFYDFTCAEVGPNTVTITATDQNANSTVETVVVTVMDTLKPDVQALDFDVYLDENGEAAISVADVDAGSSTACGIDTLYLDTYGFNCTDAGINEVALIAISVNGVTATDTALINVIDSIKPIADAQDISIYLDAAGQASITVADIDNGSSDECGIDTLILDVYDFTCTESGVNTVNLSVIDNNGNISITPANVDVLDTISPVLATQDFTIYLDDFGQASLEANDVVTSATDNCLIDTLLLDKYNFNCADIGTVTVNISALDPSGNNVSGSAEITVIDTINPVVIAQDISVYLDASGTVNVLASDVDAGSGTACGMDTLLLDKYQFTCADLGPNVVILTAVKPNQNSTSDTAIVTVFDTLGPVLDPMDINVYLNSNGAASIVLEDVDPNINDACGLDSATIDITDFTCAEVGGNTVTLSAWDIYGNFSTASATVSVLDTIAPSFNTNDITLYLDASGQAAISPADVSSGASDFCGMDTIILDMYNFTCAEAGDNEVTVTATDINANAASQQVNVRVIDTIDPVLSTMDLDIYLDANGQAAIFPIQLIDAIDDACMVDTLILSQYDFDCSDLGVNSVTLTAVDPFGNSTSSTSSVTVYDTVSPVVASQNVDIYLDTNGNISIYSLDVATYLHEACMLDSLYFSKEMFACADLGENRIGMTAVDASGNIIHDSLTVTVQDTTPPNLVNQNLTVYLDASGNASITASDVNQLTTDVCGIDTIYLDRYNFSCADVGENTVTLTAVDLNGTPGSAPATVTVVDTIQPIASARNLTVYLDSNGLATISMADVDNGSYDANCSYNLTISDSIFDCSEAGLNLETLTITDGSGNLQSVDFFVTVLDTMSPILVLRDLSITLNANGKAFITADQMDSLSTDNCANMLSFVASQTAFDCSHIGVNSVAVTATDNKLNSTTAYVNVTVVDGTAPTVVTRDTTIYLNVTGTAGATAQFVDNGTSDNCGMDSLWLSKSLFDGNDLGQNTVQLFAKDLGGNITSGNAIITVMDTMKPAISAQSIDIYLDAGGQAVFNALATAAASDNHGIASMNVSKTHFDCADLGTNIISVTAVDFSANSQTAPVTINVLDSLGPNTQTRNLTVYLNASGVAQVTPADVDFNSSDNCGITSRGISRNAFSCADLGSNVVTFLASDAAGNVSGEDLVITVLDTINPTLTNMPADITVGSDPGTCGALVGFNLPTALDNCGGPSFNTSHLPGDFFPVGTTTVQFTVADGSGNTITGDLNITVTDDLAPMLTSMPENDTVGACEAFYFYNMPQALDNCSGIVSVTQISGIPSGGYYPVGTTTNSFRISDSRGNDTIVSFSLVVKPMGQPSLPNILAMCENDDPVDFALGQSMHWSGKGMVDPVTFDPASAGVGYHQLDYTFIDDYGCATSGSITITVAPQPVQPVISRIGSTTLTTGAYDTYQWYRDGVAIPGATSQTYAYTQGGNYQVAVTNTASCENHSNGIIVGKSGGGIGLDEATLSDLSIYPNPTNGIITIDLGTVSRAELEASLYSISGKKVLSKKEFTEADGKMILDLGNLPKSTYILHISSDSEVVVRQIVLY